jgi:hypothetical protein
MVSDGAKSTALCCCAVAVVLLVVLLPFSFGYVNHTEIAFQKNKIGGKVDTSKLYTMGRHYQSPLHTFIKFPATFQTISFSRGIQLETSEGPRVTLYSSFQYRLRQDGESMKALWDTYSKTGAEEAYRQKVEQFAQDILMKNPEKFTIRAFYTERDRIRETFNSLLDLQLKEKMMNAVEVPPGKFHLLEVTLPTLASTELLNVVVKNEEVEASRFNNEADRERKVTLAQKEKVISQTNAMVQSARGRVSAIRQEAESKAYSTRQGAIANGYKEMFDLLKMTRVDHKMQLIKLISVQKDTRLLVNLRNKLTINIA